MPPIVNKKDHDKILQDFQMQSEKRVIGIQPDIFCDGQRGCGDRAVVTDEASPSDSNFRKNWSNTKWVDRAVGEDMGYKDISNPHGQRGTWSRKQTLEKICEISVQKNAVLETTTAQDQKTPRLW